MVSSVDRVLNCRVRKKGLKRGKRRFEVDPDVSKSVPDTLFFSSPDRVHYAPGKRDFALSFLSTPNNGTSCNGCNFSAFQGHCGREGNSEIHVGFEIARGDTRMWHF